MDLKVIIAAIVVVGYFLFFAKGKEDFKSPYDVPFRPATSSEEEQLGVYAWGCRTKWAGTPGWTPSPVLPGSEVAVCKLPSKITNQEMLNYQLAGRICDIKHMHQTQGCKTPGVIENPYDFDVSRGYYRLY